MEYSINFLYSSLSPPTSSSSFTSVFIFNVHIFFIFLLYSYCFFPFDLFSSMYNPSSALSASPFVLNIFQISPTPSSPPSLQIQSFFSNVLIFHFTPPLFPTRSQLLPFPFHLPHPYFHFNFIHHPLLHFHSHFLCFLIFNFHQFFLLLLPLLPLLFSFAEFYLSVLFFTSSSFRTTFSSHSSSTSAAFLFPLPYALLIPRLPLLFPSLTTTFNCHFHS